MNRSLTRAVIALTFMLVAAATAHAQQRPYTEGPVINVTEIRTKPGQFENYMNYIFGDYARLMEAQQAAGLIVAWGVYTVQPRSPDEADVILTTVYANMAAFDGLADREEAIVQRVLNRNREQAEAGYAQRESMRTLIGSSLLRTMQPRQ
jgi:hypothetical protein